MTKQEIIDRINELNAQNSAIAVMQHSDEYEQLVSIGEHEFDMSEKCCEEVLIVIQKHLRIEGNELLKKFNELL